MYFKYHFILISFFILNYSCSQQSDGVKNSNTKVAVSSSIDSLKENESFYFINMEGEILKERFSAPKGYQRFDSEEGSFGYYLQHLKLQPHGSKVKYYDGSEKTNYGVYLAVLDQEIGNQDLHQCADAIMNLYARHHFEQQRFDEIHFNFTNGWRCDFKKYAEGYRISLQGNSTNWVKKKDPSYSIKTFEEYLIWIYSYCGTASLEKELQKVDNLLDVQIGDVFIKGGYPGHAVLVVDMVKNDAGEKKIMLAQSYMPAQQMQILQNPINEDENNPWYTIHTIQNRDILETPEWRFELNQLKRFK